MCIYHIKTIGRTCPIQHEFEVKEIWCLILTQSLNDRTYQFNSLVFVSLSVKNGVWMRSVALSCGGTTLKKYQELWVFSCEASPAGSLHTDSRSCTLQSSVCVSCHLHPLIQALFILTNSLLMEQTTDQVLLWEVVIFFSN